MSAPAAAGGGASVPEAPKDVISAGGAAAAASDDHKCEYRSKLESLYSVLDEAYTSLSPRHKDWVGDNWKSLTYKWAEDMEQSARESCDSTIEGINFACRFSPAAHKCDPKDNEDCKGQECQYNALCGGGCDCVLTPAVHIYCLERADQEVTVCSSCYDNLKEAMVEEGGWTADGEDIE